MSANLPTNLNPAQRNSIGRHEDVSQENAAAKHILDADCCREGNAFVLFSLPRELPGLFTVRFTAPAGFIAGDRISLKGREFLVKTRAMEDAEEGVFAAGAVVRCDIDMERNLAFVTAGGEAGFVTDAEHAADLATKADVTHGHAIADVAGLDAALAGKADAGHTHPAGSDETVPAGTILHFAGAAAPAGYLLCDGATVSRETYAALFAAIGTMYGAGDGTTTFSLPNFAGMFLRGAGGNAATIGTEQEDAIRNIVGTFYAANYGGAAPSGVFRRSYLANGSVQGGATVLPHTGETFDASNVVPTANENRPVNFAVLLCIKY